MTSSKNSKGYTAQRVTFPMLVGSLQIGMIILFAIFGRYSPDVLPAKSGVDETHQPANEYAAFQDVNVMIFVGFGFLMTFLKRYSYSSVGLNFMLAAFCVQWATILKGLFNLGEDGTFTVNLSNMLVADFATATVLISFGAVLGKASPTQLIIMALVEIVFAQINEHIGMKVFRVTDAGASIFVHSFGAYFGLAVAWVLYRDDISYGDGEGASYHSDVFAMIGTIFLWLFWPSFNGGALLGAEQNRAFINTFYSLATCCVVSFIMSWLVDAKFNMVHVQNATLAGGVAIGTAADLLVKPFGAMIVGAVAAVISVLGYKFMTPKLYKLFKIHDTCGVNNLHGMPGLLAGFIGAMMASSASVDDYGIVLFDKFPARLPEAYFTESYNETLKHLGPSHTAQLNERLTSHGFGSDRSAPTQAGYQIAAVAVTLAIAVASGIVTGFILKWVVFDVVQKNRLFEDDYLWEVADFAPNSVDVKAEQPKATITSKPSDLQVVVEMQEVTTPLV